MDDFEVDYKKTIEAGQRNLRTTKLLSNWCFHAELDMLSKKKRDTIAKTLIMAAVANYRDVREEFDFELCGEACKAKVRDTWDDSTELHVEVVIGGSDLVITGFYYTESY